MGNYSSPQPSAAAFLFMVLLAVQFGVQPLLFQCFVSPDFSRQLLVIQCELIKLGLALACLFISEGPQNAFLILRKWSLFDSLFTAGLPAIIYSIQNLLIQYSHLFLDALMFNLLNQTKILFSAMFLFLIMKRRQSRVQIMALFALVLAVGMIAGEGNPKIQNSWTFALDKGVLPCLSAAVLSGIATALSQYYLEGKQRNVFIFSAELAIYSVLFLVATFPFTQSGKQALKVGLLFGWRHWTWIPLTTNAFGGIIVGLVTKYAGGVQKGFSIVIGIILTAFLHFLVDDRPLHSNIFFASFLIVLSTILYSMFPCAPSNSKVKKNQ